VKWDLSDFSCKAKRRICFPNPSVENQKWGENCSKTTQNSQRTTDSHWTDWFVLCNSPCSPKIL